MNPTENCSEHVVYLSRSKGKNDSRRIKFVGSLTAYRTEKRTFISSENSEGKERGEVLAGRFKGRRKGQTERKVLKSWKRH